MPKKRQALVEFEDLESARSCVTFTVGNPIYVSGQPAYFNYSTSQKISRPGGGEDRASSANHILLFTIINPAYPITTDVLYTICNPCGPVQRIVIFRKNGLQAMVEFDSVQSAQRAKASLNGADIYSGCCTLKIEYAKPTRLNVFKNDSETWDYTNANLGRQDDKRQRTPALLGDHPNNAYGDYAEYNQGYQTEEYPPGTGYDYSGQHQGGGGVGGGGGGGGAYQGYQGYGQEEMGAPARMGANRMGRVGPPPMHHQQSAQATSKVLMVYGFDPERINCDKVFNILCLYGNVEKIKFMKSKPGAVMVEMSDPFAVDRAIHHLNQASIFQKKINLCVSKQQAIMPSQSYDLSDGTCSFKDYTASRNNRFSNPEKAAKNRIQLPSNILHFFNAAPDVSEERFNEMCDEFEVKRPMSFKMFAGKSDKSASGLLEWDDKNDAMEALALINHYQMKNPTGQFPYTLKLCFSTSQHNADHAKER
uniref:Heterogeneous nuclear ribonucleoprotein L-like isoform X2 n=1 Tax=Petromyzon marinus TaxID=7757 RepID=A0AAJ7TL99_PETMA|nr:heterogeneous nuclear ribonucleoprotein L-like isoform X2 [Petromyzon marinus]